MHIITRVQPLAELHCVAVVCGLTFVSRLVDRFKSLLMRWLADGKPLTTN
jgi:hypothetical protein